MHLPSYKREVETSFGLKWNPILLLTLLFFFLFAVSKVIFVMVKKLEAFQGAKYIFKVKFFLFLLSH